MVSALDDALTAPPPRRRAAVAAGGEATRVMGRTPPPAPPARTGSPAGRPRRGWGVGAVIALAALLLLVAGAVALMSGDDPGTEPSAREEPTPTATATATPEETAAPEETATPEPTPEPTAEATAEPQDPKPKKKKNDDGLGNDPAQLQLQAFELNNAGQHEQALAPAQRAVELCQGSGDVDPCAYALFEYARALRLTGDPNGAIAALEERKQRFPDNQPGAVEEELALARQAAGGGGGDD
jgi:tetratricopeptide (TPR) repeat protein